MSSTIPIKRYFSLHLGLIVTLPIIVIASLSWIYLLPVMKSRIATHHQGLSQSIAQQISVHLDGGERQLSALTQYLESQAAVTGKDLFLMLDSMCGEGEYFETIYLSSKKTNIVKSVGLANSRRLMRDDFLGLDLSGREFIEKVKISQKPVWSATFLSTASGRLAVARSVPMTDQIVTAEITLDKLSKFISLLPVEGEYVTLVVDKQGRIVADSQRLHWGQQFHLDKLELIQTDNNAQSTSVSFFWEGKEMLGAIVTIDNLGWSVLTAQPIEYAFGPLRSTFISIGLGLSTVLLIALIVSWFLAGRFSKNIQLCSKQAEAIAKGNYNLSWPTPKTKEILNLKHSLEHMAQKIHQRETDLIESETHLQITLDSIGDAVIATEVNGKIIRLNPTAEKLTGWYWEEAEERDLLEIFQIYADGSREKAIDLIKMVLTENEIVHLSNNTILISREGKESFITASAAPIIQTEGVIVGIVVVFQDVTEKKRIEEVLVQSEKMMSVGGLAAGIAHEINNPLAGMIQNAAILQSRITNQHGIKVNQQTAKELGISIEAIEAYMKARKIPKMLNAINESGKRVSEIINNMLSFARQSDSAFSTHDIEEIMNKTIELSAADYNLRKKYDFKNIKINKEYGQNLPVIQCASPQIQQVFLNILNNSAQAMQMAKIKAPQLTIRTCFEKSRQMIRVEIEDNGPGMDESTRKRIFEPFFTTKPTGSGTGLGLSVSYFIITDYHGGEMMVDSKPGHGSKFVILLPITKN